MAHMCLEVNLHPIYFCVLGPFSCPLTYNWRVISFIFAFKCSAMEINVQIHFSTVARRCQQVAMIGSTKFGGGGGEK